MKLPDMVTVPVKVWVQVGDRQPAVVGEFDWTAPIEYSPAKTVTT